MSIQIRTSSVVHPDWIDGKKRCCLFDDLAHFVHVERTIVRGSFLAAEREHTTLGPMAYEHLRNEKFSEELEMAEDIVKASVVAILFLSPIGASLISRTGPILLDRTTEEQRQREREMSYLRILSFLPTPVQPLTTNDRETIDRSRTDLLKLDDQPDRRVTEYS